MALYAAGWRSIEETALLESTPTLQTAHRTVLHTFFHPDITDLIIEYTPYSFANQTLEDYFLDLGICENNINQSFMKSFYTELQAAELRQYHRLEIRDMVDHYLNEQVVEYCCCAEIEECECWTESVAYYLHWLLQNELSLEMYWLETEYRHCDEIYNFDGSDDLY